MEIIFGILFLAITLLIALFIRTYTAQKAKKMRLGLFLILASFLIGILMLFYTVTTLG
ncbi:MAG: hypothetical protein IPH89_06925 [Bacteroidetes bacterium]|nr:hypothetical protein [Bacteroidota bacterium]